ncbi:hypothetical protein BC938DRAFT_479217 [Jimgerdemannia flammicorona]|uniref:Cholesterol oxidase n=1 Tax=Jimgerdemannia flammicorona TaxID=994334 RepID=A0A433QLC6_9FUNG|nr:hypothetical protein BC938DRAFT_479217 [Jimgerdemannia flammicorona]
MSPTIPHISKELAQMRRHYDVVVVGSGYGGGISASRMSRAGKRVALLEKGKNFVTNIDIGKSGGLESTRRKRWSASRRFKYPRLQHIMAKKPACTIFTKAKTSTLSLRMGKLSDSIFVKKFVTLGGTSLLNANVALRADERVWQQNIWPEEINQDMESIRRGKSEFKINLCRVISRHVFIKLQWPTFYTTAYGRAEEMLQPNPYPEDFPTPPKLAVLEEQAKLLGDAYHKNFYRPPIAVTFEDRVNNAGVMQYKSTLTGNDSTGVNDGSKNSTLMNYIPDAWNHGCEIFCEIEVKRVKYDEKNKKWIIFYEWLGAGRPAFKDDAECCFFVTADVLFLAAGTMGTNEILLRSKNFGLPVSNRLGEGFSGNGDILGFGYNINPLVNGVAMGNHSPRWFKQPVGPTITGIIDMRNQENVLNGYVIEEGVIPAAMGGLMNTILNGTRIVSPYQSPSRTVTESLRHTGRGLLTSLLGCYTGAVAHTQTYLIMSHDDNQGELTLVNDNLKVSLRDAGKTDRIRNLNNILARATDSIGGTFVPSPLWTVLDKEGLITVHPIGGCNMAKSGDDGVVNHKGQVYKDHDTSVHDSLYVCDGAIIPTALGVNPFFTISALAERVCELAAKDRGWKIDYSLAKKPIDFEHPLRSYDDLRELQVPLEGGVRFTETMKGFFSTEITSEDYASAEAQAKSSDSRMAFLLTIIAYDTRTHADMKANSSEITGTVSCRALSADPILVTSGHFRLFAPDESRADADNLVYKLYLLSTDGSEYTFEAFKRIDNEQPSLGWSQTTTLYVTVKDKNKVRGRGILHLTPRDFMVELSTLTVSQTLRIGFNCFHTNRSSINYIFASPHNHAFFKPIGKTFGQRLAARIEFVTKFSWNMSRHYLTWLLPLQFPADFAAAKPFSLPRPEPETWTVTASDGVQTLLTRYKGGLKGPVLLIPGAAVTHEIWATTMTKHNFLDYLLKNEYDVFLQDNRISPNVPASHDQSSMDDLILDHVAHIEKVREVTRCDKIAVVAHCVGSMSFFMGLLNGSIQGVGSVVASNVGMHPILGTVNRVKASIGLTTLWEKVFRKDSFDTNTSRNDTFLNRLTNLFLRFYPVPHGEACRNAVCKRISFTFGLLWQHGNLNEQFHEHLNKIVGHCNVSALKHITLVARRKVLVDANGDSVYVTDENIKKHLNLPILFIHGEQNVCIDPEATKKSYNVLRELNGEENYKRRTFPGYGHLDCWFGSDAHKEIFPTALKQLEETKKQYGYTRRID